MLGENGFGGLSAVDASLVGRLSFSGGELTCGRGCVGEEAEAAEVGAEVGVDFDPDDGGVGDEDLDRLLVEFFLGVEGDPLVGDAGDSADVVSGAVGGEELHQGHRA